MADYWVFGGIYRPVYLEVVPQQFIERVAIDARADGTFAMDVFLDGVTDTDTVEAQIVTVKGKKVGEKFSGKPLFPSLPPTNGESVANTQGEGSFTLSTRLQTNVASPKLWTAETPNLYRLVVEYKDSAGKLVSATSPVAGVVEIHEMVMDGNVMKMRAVTGLELPAGKAVELKPGGYHVMLMDLKQELKAGESVPLTLVIEGAGGKRETLEVKAPVRALAESSGPKKH